MTVRKFYVSYLVIALFFGCNLNADQVLSEKKKLNYYNETPGFIKSYLDSVCGGKFLIAEPSQNWNSGCLVSHTEPWCQFISATLSKTEYQIKFRSGGLVVSDNLWTVHLKDKKVLTLLKSE